MTSARPALKSRSGMPFLRITLLGGRSCGKTCLATAWVNNNCPSRYIPTDSARLYYKACRIYSEDEDGIISLLVEVEDTPASDKGISADAVEANANLIDPEAALPISGFLDLGTVNAAQLQRQMQRMSTVKSKKQSFKEPSRPTKEQVFAMRHPLLSYEAPRRYQEVKQHGHEKALTKNRMGYIIIFDSNEETSFQEAQKVYRMLIDSLKTKKQDDKKPPTWLVASKVDKNPASLNHHRIMESARIWSEQVCVPLWRVSSQEFGSVRKLFHEMLMQIRANQSLWAMDHLGADEEEPEEKKCVLS